MSVKNNTLLVAEGCFCKIGKLFCIKCIWL